MPNDYYSSQVELFNICYYLDSWDDVTITRITMDATSSSQVSVVLLKSAKEGNDPYIEVSRPTDTGDLC